MQLNKVTAPMLSQMKANGEKISVLTAYDYSGARLLDEAGIDVALVGDSLGMVVLGYDSTLNVTMDDMIRHTSAVKRGIKRAFIVSDMPFLSYNVSIEETIKNAGRLVVEGGAEAVKMEGGEQLCSTIRKLVDIGIPVVGHIGLQPQSVNVYGGFKMRGKNELEASKIKYDALALQDAGVCAIVLESIPDALAREITASLATPTIGIGAGPDCDGHVLISHDILGMYDKIKPSFVKQYADLWTTSLDAYKAYNKDIKEGLYPERKK
ncbi:MAG: 3-methyl-2-oxobutanoate hydroxymethyltransferase [Armatimonadota bacterium]